MNVLITGSTGFVGKHLRKELESNGYTVYGLSSKATENENTFQCDIKDAAKLSEIMHKIKPEGVFHLAGFSSVAKSFQDPQGCHDVNVNGTKNLFEAIKNSNLKCKVLIVSSGEIYGKANYVPTDESHDLKPLSPYGESRLKQEALVKDYDIPVIIARSYSHTGDDQPDIFVLPSFKKQIKEAQENGVIKVGNLDIVRDFSDVEDVVKAYRLLFEKGQIGEAYNVGSGKGYNLKFVIDRMVAVSGIKGLKAEVDPERFRPADTPVMIADTSKMHKVTGLKFKDIFANLL